MVVKNISPIDELRALVKVGESGEKSVVSRVQHLLDRHEEITHHFGDAAKVVSELWLPLYAGNNELVVEATRRKMVTLKATLAGPEPSPLESLMVEQIMMCWLQMHATAALLAQALMDKSCAGILREMQRQAKASQRLHAESLKQLAGLRKLLPARSSALLSKSTALRMASPEDCAADPPDVEPMS